MLANQAHLTYEPRWARQKFSPVFVSTKRTKPTPVGFVLMQRTSLAYRRTGGDF